MPMRGRLAKRPCDMVARISKLTSCPKWSPVCVERARRVEGCRHLIVDKEGGMKQSRVRSSGWRPAASLERQVHDLLDFPRRQRLRPGGRVASFNKPSTPTAA